MSIPLVFATDTPPLVRPDGIVYDSELTETSLQRPSYKLHLSSEFIGPGDRLLIIDDMLSRGGTAKCLGALASKAGATVVGAGAGLACAGASHGMRARFARCARSPVSPAGRPTLRRRLHDREGV